uniref:hypothetical protein n=1 Tax=Mycoplasmopsis bovis TaxID=28903 RepID=UPI003D271E87
KKIIKREDQFIRFNKVHGDYMELLNKDLANDPGFLNKSSFNSGAIKIIGKNSSVFQLLFLYTSELIVLSSCVTLEK